MPKFIGLILSSLFSLSIYAQTVNCYAIQVAKGDSLFSLKMYDEAKLLYEEAKHCMDMPDDLSELDKKLSRTIYEINKLKAPEFTFSTDNVFAEINGARGSVTIKQRNIKNWDYNKEECPDWFVITKTDAGFDYVCQPNGEPLERTCVITFKAKNITRTFSVRQRAAAEYLTLSQNSVQASSDGGEAEVDVQTNAINGFSVATSTSWVKVISSRDDKLKLYVEQNEKHEQRTGSVFVNTKSCSKSIRINQDAKPSDFLLDIVALRIVSDFELSMSFRLKNGDHIQFDAGFWDILRNYNLSGGFSASYIWTYDFADIWSLNYGIGLGFGGVRRPYATPEGRFVIAAVPSIGIECAPDGWEIAGKQVGLTLDYRPYVGTDCAGFYHNLTNFNLGVRLHLH